MGLCAILRLHRIRRAGGKALFIAKWK
jgi:hypothetical protein